MAIKRHLHKTPIDLFPDENHSQPQFRTLFLLAAAQWCTCNRGTTRVTTAQHKIQNVQFHLQYDDWHLLLTTTLLPPTCMMPLEIHRSVFATTSTISKAMAFLLDNLVWKSSVQQRELLQKIRSKSKVAVCNRAPGKSFLFMAIKIVYKVLSSSSLSLSIPSSGLYQTLACYSPLGNGKCTFCHIAKPTNLT